MVYAEFLEQFKALDKNLKDSINKLASLEKKIGKDVENGDIKSMEKSFALIEDLTKNYLENKEKISDYFASFDYKEYFLSGNFTQEMLLSLKKEDLNVVGEYPVFEVFPTRIKLDAENQEVVLGKKKISTMRPERFASETKALIDKLESASFNALSFAQDLENAYATCIARENEKANSKKFAYGAYMVLLDCYKVMVPLSRSRKDYDEVAFAFDIARLYIENEKGGFLTKSGKTISFSTGRGKGIRILDANGKEQLFSTVSFR